ncbi:mitochondrial carrier [Lactarius akahatsu]|uniref:Mitochondrial carrier n=1 Tax=Lactarius akahatsu TaxID=416441 RepID=A0AAD4Q9V9_9AGAM|nr:mitochondrial carrier [Lactarius akahatsu]
MSSDVPKFRAVDQVIRSDIAGGIAGCVAKTVVTPLDRVKILFQASNPEYHKYAGSRTWSGARSGAFRAGAQIYKDSGTLGLFQGHSATLFRIFPYAAIKFLALRRKTNLRRFSAGAISGTISVLFTYPLELLRGIPHHSQFRAARVIYSEGAPFQSTGVPIRRDLFYSLPLLKFYRGQHCYLRSTLVPVAPNGWRPRATPLADLGIGALSGAVAQTVSYPFEVVRRRMQVGGLTEPGRRLRWGETVRAIWARGGPKGFFIGLGIGYLKMVPMNAVSFAVWQGMRRLLGF